MKRTRSRVGLYRKEPTRTVAAATQTPFLNLSKPCLLKVRIANAGAGIHQLQSSVDGGANWDASSGHYRWSWHTVTPTPGIFTAGSAGAGVTTLMRLTDSALTWTVVMDMKIYPAEGTIFWEGTLRGSGSDANRSGGSGWRTNGLPFNALLWSISASTYSGTFDLYEYV